MLIYRLQAVDHTSINTNEYHLETLFQISPHRFQSLPPANIYFDFTESTDQLVRPVSISTPTYVLIESLIIGDKFVLYCVIVIEWLVNLNIVL